LLTKKPTPFAQIAHLTQLTQIPLIIATIEAFWNDVVNVHLALCGATYLAATISGQYPLANLAPLCARTFSPRSTH
jgi:hypothetical protein